MTVLFKKLDENKKKCKEQHHHICTQPKAKYISIRYAVGWRVSKTTSCISCIDTQWRKNDLKC